MSMFSRVSRTVAKVLFGFGLIGVISSCCTAPAPKAKAPLVSSAMKTQRNQLTATVHIDDKFSVVEKERVLAGLIEWERATLGIVRFRTLINEKWNSDDPVEVPVVDRGDGKPKCNSDIYIVRGLSTDATVKDIEEKVESEIAGFANPACLLKVIVIVADQIKTSDSFKAVTVHEVGHMLGLAHIPIPNETSMFPGLPACTSCVTMLDLKQFCSIGWTCQAKNLAPCPG